MMNYHHIIKNLFFITLISCFVSENHVFAQSIQIDKKLNGLTYRNVGPTRGGRVTAVCGIPSKLHTFYMGSTGGGVWKTEDAGLTWQNISDGYFSSSSIGAIAIAPSDENVVYVGTGSACPRGNISIGDGVYKSVNGGKSWTHIGLPKAGLISKIEIHPDDPNLVYVGVLGQIFGPNPERGVYRSKDGGQTWELIHHRNDHTGVSDMVMNPENPKELYAAFWQVERKPWTLIDGGENGGIWKSTDGGDNWSKLENDLPSGLLGKIGLAISPANPERVWAVIQAKEEKEGGVYRTDDGGQRWIRINRDHKLRQRGWYYSHLTAHPTDPNTIYANNVSFFKSIDGGKTFDQRIRVPHGDNHGLWINPNYPEIMIQCNDGGACVTLNGGKTWSSQNNQPTSEIYRLTIDNQFPYRLYGAQQDNTTISVPSKAQGALTPYEDWMAVGGGESGHIAIDPRNPDLIYAGTYIGQITRLEKQKGTRTSIMAYPQMHDGVPPKDIKYRFQWNAPIRISPHDPNIVFHCSQFVHRTKDGGRTWDVISPDLTTNNPAYQEMPGGPIQNDHTGVELYTTIFAFEESPHQAGELWAGTDDGRLHISKDNGKNWEEITPSNMPKEGTINTIELSSHQAGRAIISVYKYRENDFNPYIFLTNDYGKTWSTISEGLQSPHFVRVVREDPERKGLLFAGTEFGMYCSFNEGKEWHSLQLNLPVTPITDLAIKDNDLVVATQGRSFWILDDISPLRKIEVGNFADKVKLFAPSDAYRAQFRNYRAAIAPDPQPNGALIYFYLPESDLKKDISLQIIDQTGKVRRTFSTEAKAKSKSLKVQSGLNRFEWNLKYEGPELQPKAVFSLANTGGIRAPLGKHAVKLIIDGADHIATFDLIPDPRWTTTQNDIEAQYDLAMQIKSLLNLCHKKIGQIRSIRHQLDAYKQTVKGLADERLAKTISEKIDSTHQKLNLLEEILIQSKSESGQDPINFPPKLDDQIAFLYSFVNNLDEAPNDGSYQRYEDLKKELNTQLAEFKKVTEDDVEAINQLLRNSGIKYIRIEP